MLTNRELVDVVTKDMVDRDVWEQRADQFYRMRHHGLRRKYKPFPGCSDLHFPLADSFIERLRPAFFQQLYATDTLAQFVSSKAQTSNETAAAAQWFDYRLKQHSNLESEILTVIDWMLMLGRSVVKVCWDVDNKRIKFDAIDPRQFVVPGHTVDLECPDRVTHIRQFSQDHFKASGEFETGSAEELILRLKNPQSNKESGMNLALGSIETREGVLKDEDLITVWEVWQHDDRKNWVYRCFSPADPEVVLKKDTANPFDHGMLPFIDFPYEIKDKGWYSPRGVVEMVATYEAELTNLLNQKHDALTLTNRPVFTNEGGAHINVNNFKFIPGQALPRGLKPAVWSKMPFDFQEAIQAVREIAEARVTVPDFGITRISDTTQRRTATEVNAVSTMFNQSSDLRLRIFRLSLGRLYRMSWDLLLQYAKKELDFFYVDQFQKIPSEALHKDYSIIPNGSADGVNKQFLFQKAVARFQMFNGDPFTDQIELRRGVLEQDDPTLVRKLVKDPGIKANDEREEQAMEIAIMARGLPAVVDQSDDHQSHLQAILVYLNQNILSGQVQPGVNEIPLLQQHIQEHLAALQQADPKAAKAAMDAFAVVFQQLQPQEQPA